ncbi:MAG TPA: hypothetical protein H9755_01250 [Candidatus Dietzia intestinigallinarum]|nr:hypothetical protein [Candidatus Dietzia intestinipullorum]HJC58948.1 hypothetical protein [Candidatus Dietzia intestinigallinarum]
MPRLTPDLAAKVDATETDLRRIIGRNARRIRLAASAHLEQVAHTAKRYGLPWTIGRVSDLEAGRIDAKVETLLSLALTLGEVRGEPVALTDLLDHDAPVLVNGREVANLTGAVRGEPVTESEGQRLHDELNSGDPAQVARDTAALADRRAAKSVGVDLDTLVATAVELWGHNLSVERDLRADGETNTAARGNITRDLLGEVRRHLGL